MDVEIEYINVSLFNPKTQEEKQRPFPVIFPDKLATAMLEHSEERFRDTFLGEGGDATMYWQHIRTHCEWFRGHPAFNRNPENDGKMIALSLYGDEVQSFRNTEGGLVACIGWSTDFGAGRGPLSRYFLVCILPEHYTTKRTFHDIYKALAKCVAHMCDESVQHPWTEKGYSFIYSSTQGDLKWLNDQFSFHNSRANQFCTMCQCCKNHIDISMTLGDFRPTAHHIQTRLDHDGWAASIGMNPADWHPILEIPGCRADRFMHDVLHSQLLGTGKVLNGSVLTFLCESGYFQPFKMGFGKYDLCLDSRLREAYGNFCSWKKMMGIDVNQPRFTCARLGRRMRTHYPCLSAKGAASKALSFWLSELATEHANRVGASQLDKTVATCALSYGEVLRLLDVLPALLTHEQAVEFREKGLLHLQCYSALNRMSQAQQSQRGHGVQNKALWLLLPKHHHFHHMLDETVSSQVNPSWCTLLCAESWIGIMGRISRTCHRSSLSLRALQKYKLVLALHLQSQR